MHEDREDEYVPDLRGGFGSGENGDREIARWLTQCCLENAAMRRGARLLEIVVRNCWATVRRRE